MQLIFYDFRAWGFSSWDHVRSELLGRDGLSSLFFFLFFFLEQDGKLFVYLN